MYERVDALEVEQDEPPEDGGGQAEGRPITQPKAGSATVKGKATKY